MNIGLITMAFSAFENSCTINTFLKIFCTNREDRTHDIFNFYTKNKISQTIYYKMSQHEKDAFGRFVEELIELKSYSKMCDFINNFNEQ